MPDKLKKCLKKNDLELAVYHYVYAYKLMESYDPSMFRSIESENKANVANLITKIKQQLTREEAIIKYY